MKTKSKKTVTKRFDITAKGHLKHRVGQWVHLRIKKATRTHFRKNSTRLLASSKQNRILKAKMAKPKK